MPKTETWKNMETALEPRWDDALWVRGSTYGVLGWAFTYPEPELVDYLEKSLDRVEGEDEVASELRDILEQVCSLGVDEVQRQHTALFNPSGGPPACETYYREFSDEFARAQELADINGFYRAFGLQPDHSRPDHVSAELGFMHYLVVKQKYAEHKQASADAEKCREARAEFFSEHLGRWISSFTDAVRDSVEEGEAQVYVDLADVLDLFIRSEREKVS